VYLVPVAVLLAAAGVDGLARAAQGAARRTAGRPAAAATRWAVTVAAVALLMAPMPRALADLYATAKGDDYRAAAEWLVNRFSGRGVVLATGDRPDWIALGLAHEVRQMGGTVLAVDAAQLDRQVIEALVEADWVGVATGSASQASPAAPDGWGSERVHGIDIIATAVDPASALETAAAGLQASTPRASTAALSTALLDALSRTSGPDLIHEVQRASGRTWSLPTGWAVHDGRIRIAGAAEQRDAVFDVPAPVDSAVLALTFDCRSAISGGGVRLFVSAHALDGTWLSILPTGSGYVCSTASQGRPGGFVIEVPPATDHLSVRIRADGIGEAEIRDLKLTALAVR
jgi:hypothetical protein